MQDVTLVDVDTEGTYLVLKDKDGHRYKLTVDDELRAALGGELANKLNVIKAAADGPLRPKEIQAHIRGGMSAEDLAAAAGMPLAQIKPYELPVLAEREHVAFRARGTALTRTSSAEVLLEDAVTERLAAREAEPGRLWDAWREESGTWVVQLVFTAGGRARRARWRFDLHAATLEPVDDEARWLSDAPAPKSPAVKGPKERVYDVEADGGVIEAEGDEDEEPAEPKPADSPTLDLLDALRGRRGQRQPVGSADLMEGQTDLVDALLDGEEPPAAHPPASRPDLATDAAILALPKNVDPGPSSSRRADAPKQAEEARPARATSATGTPAAASPDSRDEQDERAKPGSRPKPDRFKQDDRSKQTGGKKGKPSIPSWDDIVFGTRRD